jgi:hypothetical protein
MYQCTQKYREPNDTTPMQHLCTQTITAIFTTERKKECNYILRLQKNLQVATQTYFLAPKEAAHEKKMKKKRKEKRRGKEKTKEDQNVRHLSIVSR